MISSKVCRACGERKPGDEFSTHPKSGDGLDYICLACARVRQDDYRRRNPGKNAESAARWREKPGNKQINRDRMKAKDRARARLAERHAEEYADLLDEERAALGLPPAERRRLVG